MRKLLLISTSLTVKEVELPDDDTFNVHVHKLLDCELYETAPLINGFIALVDEFGKIKAVPKHMNCLATLMYPNENDILVGDVLVTKIGTVDGESDFVSLSDEDINWLKRAIDIAICEIRMRLRNE